VSYNAGTIIGNLGKDPEVKYLTSGMKLAKFSVATTDNIKKGEVWEKKTNWFNVVAFSKVAEKVERDLQKGSTIHLEYKLSNSTWETEGGEKRSKVELIARSIMVLKGRKESNGEVVENVPESADNIVSGDIDSDLPF